MGLRAIVSLRLILLCIPAFLIMTMLLPAGILAQSEAIETEELRLPIGLTAEEKTRLHEIGMGHLATPPPPGPVRKCAQWEPIEGVLIRYNRGFGIPYDLIREYAEDLTVYILCRSRQQNTCYNNLSNNNVNMDNIVLIDLRTDSIWTRDYGPQIIFCNGMWCFADHIYNRPRPYDDQIPVDLGELWGCNVYGSDLVHSGGNFMPDGHGTGFSTDMIWEDNSGLSHGEIAQMMEDYVGITNYVVLPSIDPGGIHHIDCWAKLVNEETIIVKEIPPGHPHYDQLEANVAYLETLTNCYGRPYNIVRINCGGIGGDNVAAYTNSLILNNKVFVPTYGISTDAAALATYAAAMPGYEVLGFGGEWLSDDAIHCRGIGIFDRQMLMVDTNPLQDREINDSDYEVTAFVDDRSETGLIAGSPLVYWRVEGSADFNYVVMPPTADPDIYVAAIPQQDDEVNIEYYISAEDNSGRRAARPITAPTARYSFYTGSAAPVATLLQNYSAEFNEPHIVVRWTLAEAGTDMQFYVSRVEAAGGTFSELFTPEIEREDLSFTFRDRSITAGASYRYRVEVADEAGRRILFDTEPVSIPSLRLALFQNHPNPFNPSTTIRFYLPEESFVTVKVYDATGREISSLVDRHLEEGYHSVDWIGQDAFGNAVTSGVYFYSLKSGKEILTRKMILLR